jgi:hypothetical protein
MPTEAQKAAARIWLEKNSAPLNLPEVGIMGRLLSGFADTPEGKQGILDRFGIEGSLRDPEGLGRDDVMTAPNFQEGLNRLGGKMYEGARDVADIVSDVPAALGAGLGTAAGFAAGTLAGPAAAARLGMAGGGMGAAIGDMGRQSIGGLLGSGESPNLGRTAGEGFLGMLGALLPGAGAKVVNRATGPFTKSASTAAVQEVKQDAEKYGIRSLPADAITESDFVARAAARARAAATPHGDVLRQGRNTLRAEQSDAFENIAREAGSSSRLPTPSVDVYTEAGQKTLEARKAALGGIYDEARSIMGNTDFPVIINQTEAAIGRMSKRTGSSDLPDANITSAARREIDLLLEDVSNIETYGQLNAFRRLIGDKLSNRQFLLEMKKAGHEVNYEDIYGALKRDLQESLPEGKLAQEFGGQTRGQLGRTIENQGTKNVSEMEAGRLGESGLPDFPGRAGEVARGKIPDRPGIKDPPSRTMTTESSMKPFTESIESAAQEPDFINFQQRDITPRSPSKQRSSTELLDELSGRVDKTQALQDVADTGFSELMKMDNKQIINIINDPTQAETIYSVLFRRNASPENLRVFKRYIGAEATPGGQAASEEGKAAYQEMVGQVFKDLRSAGEDVFAERLRGQVVPLDGKKLIERLDGMGGEELLAEGIGRETAAKLYDFGHFLINSAPTQRAFSQVSKDAGGKTNLAFFIISLVRRTFDEIVDAGLRSSSFPGPGKMSTFLTTGMPKKNASGIMRAIGSAATTPIGRADTGPETSWE